MQDQLHPAALVEEPLQDQGPLRRQNAERRAGRLEVLDDLLHRGAINPRDLRDP